MRHHKTVNATTSICPSCGKVTVESYSMCMYCGIRLPSIVCDSENVNISQVMPEKLQTLNVTDDGTQEWGEYASLIMDSPMISQVSAKERVNSPKPVAKTKMDSTSVSASSPRKSMTTTTDSQTGKNKKQSNPAVSKSEKTPGIPLEFRAFVKKLGKQYKLVKCLGKGGMATIFLAREESLDRLVAIKLLSQRLLRDGTFVKRFILEAKTAARLEHPNIVRIHSITAEKDVCYFIMSHIPEGTLADKLKGQPLDTNDVVRIAMEMCSALEYAHSSGVVHRDIKPSNILFASDGRAVLADFGIARSFSNATLTTEGQVLGTPRYMSPEQALGKRVDAGSDLYSLGAVLYELVTGRAPFLAENAVSYMYKHVHVEPTPPIECNPDIPLGLNDAILRCLAKQPRDRYNSVSDLRKTLSHVITKNERFSLVGKVAKDQGLIPVFLRFWRWFFSVESAGASGLEMMNKYN